MLLVQVVIPLFVVNQPDKVEALRAVVTKEFRAEILALHPRLTV